MTEGFFEALTQITRERKVDRDVLIDTLAGGLRSAVRRKHGADAEVDVQILPDKGTIEIHLVMTVVTEEDLDNEDCELTVEEAREYIDNPEVGDIIRIPLDVKEFGRNAIMTAKQVLVQGVREAERERIFNEYSKRVGEIVSGTVQQVDRGNVLVNLGRAEALLPYREQIRRERHRQGDPVKGLVLEVQRESRGPQIILSRTHPDFLLRLFEQEIPEVYEGLVELKAIAREPGWRSKVAVTSKDDRVDAVGACVGMKGARVMTIVKELSGERIDIVHWDPDTVTFVTRALSPAQVSSVKIADWDRGEMMVIVAEDQLSLAIGKEGQNVRLAAKLTGWKIDLVTTEILALRERAESEIHMEMADLDGVTPRLLGVLEAGGFTTLAQLAAASDEALQAIEGVGPKTAEKLLARARDAVVDLHRRRDEFIDTERRRLEQERRERDDLFREGVFTDDGEKAAPEPETVKGPLFKEDAFDEPAPEADEEPAAEAEPEADEADEEPAADAEPEADEADEEPAAETEPEAPEADEEPAAEAEPEAPEADEEPAEEAEPEGALDEAMEVSPADEPSRPREGT